MSPTTRLPAFALAFLIAPACLAEATKLPIDVQKPLYDAQGFHQILAARELPQPIVALCADARGRLADPGGRWEPTDVITNESLPTKRLVWAASDGHYYVVHYERGGYAHSFHVLVAVLERSRVQFLWRGISPGPIKDYSAFLRVLQRGELDDRLDYAY